MMDNVPDVLTLKDLMNVLQIGRCTALALLQEGYIDAHKTSYGWRIFKEDVIEYLTHI